MVAEVARPTCCASRTRSSSTPPKASIATRFTAPCSARTRASSVRSQRSDPAETQRRAKPPASVPPRVRRRNYDSFLGVPILRAGNTLGVLVVQTRAKRTYVEEEVEALQTTAMVLAKMIASGELAALAQPGAEPAARHPWTRPVRPCSTASRLAMWCGTSRASSSPTTLPRTCRGNQAARHGAGETTRRSRPHAGARRCRRRWRTLRRAVSLPDVRQRSRLVAPAPRGGRHRPDRGGRVERVQSDTRARMLRSIDPYSRERLHDSRSRPSADADNWSGRITRRRANTARQRHPDPARDGPCGAARLRPQAPARAALEEGTATHVAIVARALGIRRSAKRRTRRVSPIPAMPSLSTAPRVRSMSVPHRKSNWPMRSGCGFAQDGRRSIRRCATCRASPGTVSPSN